MADGYSGVSRSSSRVNVSPKTSHPKSSKVIDNKMSVKMGVPGGNGKMYTENYAKRGGERDKVDFSPTGKYEPGEK